MPPTQPYQPFLLRLLHGGNALLVIGAIVSGFLVYNTYDRRWIYLALPTIPDIQGLHGTFGLCFLLLMPAFALYSCFAGAKRLIQSDSLAQVRYWKRPLGRYSLHRLINTWMLLAAIFAALSGRMMQEEWLPAGQLNHSWYLIHLTAWGVMIFSLLLHLLAAANVGGWPLLRSIMSWKIRPIDHPRHWPDRLLTWVRQWRS